jgi:hypothetical protein
VRGQPLAQVERDVGALATCGGATVRPATGNHQIPISSTATAVLALETV